MRRYKALVIHDDPKIVDELSEVRESLGHEHQWVRSQAEARQLLSAHDDYAYILLDLEIPARPKCGQPRLRNGMNLLEEIRSDERLHGVPVILIARRCLAKLRLVVWVMKHGAFDVIEKPFPVEGYTLDRAIKKALIYYNAAPSQGAAVPAPARPIAPQPFRGGEMVLYPDRVELCGVKIVGDTGTGQARMILDLLARKPDGNRYVHMSGETLAMKIGAGGGIGTVTGCIRTIRRNATDRLMENLNLIVGSDDVIANDGVHGYCLREWITVREAAVEGQASPPAGRDTDGEPDRDPDEPDAGHHDTDARKPDTDRPDTDAGGARRRHILDLLRANRGLQAPAIAGRLRCSLATAKRELGALTRAGVVEFVGHARTGCYRLTGHVRP